MFENRVTARRGIKFVAISKPLLEELSPPFQSLYEKKIYLLIPKQDNPIKISFKDQIDIRTLNDKNTPLILH
jgi:hypothetical protein